MTGEPIERYVRNEVPPDDAVVVVRGGPIAVEKIVEHARRAAVVAGNNRYVHCRRRQARRLRAATYVCGAPLRPAAVERGVS
jgi:hypothetical protein